MTLRDIVVRQPESTVIEDLTQKDNVCQRVIYGQDDHGRQNTLKNSSEDIEDISRQPYDNEHNRKSFSRPTSEVLDDLRGENNYPACNRD
jgi:hypothetical protein